MPFPLFRIFVETYRLESSKRRFLLLLYATSSSTGYQPQKLEESMHILIVINSWLQ